MILNFSNEIDKKISEKFSDQTIQNMKFGTLGYLGINITSASDNDFNFKLYYDLEHSLALYNKTKHSSIVNDLFEKKLVNSIEIAHEENGKKCSRFNLKANCENNKDAIKLFSFLDTKIDFFKKYHNEIQKLSQMKVSDNENQNYASLISIGFAQENNTTQILKFYWSCEHRNKQENFDSSYYLSFLQENTHENLNDIIEISKKALINCEAKLWMIGNDYTKEGSLNAKIYIDNALNLYDGLSKTFTNYNKLIEKIKIIETWHKIHPEFYCEGFAIGKNSKNEITLNFYFKLKMNKLKNLIKKFAKKQAKQNKIQKTDM